MSIKIKPYSDRTISGQDRLNICLELEQWARSYRKAQKPEDRAGAAVGFLGALSRLYMEVADPQDREASKLLGELRQSFADAQRGGLEKFKKRGGRKSKSRQEKFNLARASAAVDCLAEGSDQKKAARKVARHCKKVGIEITGTQPDKPLYESLLDWRENMRRGTFGEETRQWYENAKLNAGMKVRWLSKEHYTIEIDPPSINLNSFLDPSIPPYIPSAPLEE